MFVCDVGSATLVKRSKIFFPLEPLAYVQLAVRPLCRFFVQALSS